MGTALVEWQLAAAWPSPSSSLAEKTQTPWRVLQVPVAQLAGVVWGTCEAQSASVVQDALEEVSALPS
jgi:hypothetical protein